MSTRSPPHPSYNSINSVNPSSSDTYDTYLLQHSKEMHEEQQIESEIIVEQQEQQQEPTEYIQYPVIIISILPPLLPCFFLVVPLSYCVRVCVSHSSRLVSALFAPSFSAQ